MSLPHDMLEQANELVERDPRRPKQASLRRSVSTAYYALFHLLTESSAELLVSGTGPGRDALRKALRRSYVHGDMKSISKSFASGTPPEIWKAAAGAISSHLRTVAEAFVELQDARHDADYDHTRSWTRQEATELVQRVKHAFEAWQRTKRSQDAAAYCVALLARTRK